MSAKHKQMTSTLTHHSRTCTALAEAEDFSLRRMACFAQQLSLMAIGRIAAAIKGHRFNTRQDARRLAFFFAVNSFCVILELDLYKKKWLTDPGAS